MRRVGKRPSGVSHRRPHPSKVSKTQVKFALDSVTIRPMSDFQVPRFKFQGRMFVVRGVSGGNLGDATVLQGVLQRDCCEAVLSGRVATNDSLVKSRNFLARSLSQDLRNGSGSSHMGRGKCPEDLIATCIVADQLIHVEDAPSRIQRIWCDFQTEHC